MRDHVSIIGALFIVYGVCLLTLTLPLFLVTALPGASLLAAGEAVAMGTAYVVVAFLMGALLEAFGLSCLFVGQGIRARAGWARSGGVLCGALALATIPLGTLLGLYAFVILLDEEVVAEFA